MKVDLRSDVLTKATPAMLGAMMSGTFGDDVYDEDETTHRLQAKAAKLAGAEAGLFTVSGTMANQLAIAAQTFLHDEVILDVNSHIFQFEQGAPAVISGVQLRPIEFVDGLPDEKQLETLVRFPNIHHPTSRMLCLEITHNARGGYIPDFEKYKSVCKKAGELGLKIHVDGARIWNAVIAAGIPLADYFRYVDSMMFCFSKGLGAPVGSILLGKKETVEKAHYLRKGLGGGWRQPGMLAAAAIYALDNHIGRLSENHSHASVIAEAVMKNSILELAERVDTNMVFFRPKNLGRIGEISDILTENGILNSWRHFRDKIRLVTHLNITEEMTAYTADVISKLA